MDTRTTKSAKNIYNGLFSQVISILLSFVVRSFFIIYLNKEYLGINGLFSNILTILSFVEIGFGPAIMHALYKPLAENDESKIKALINLFVRAYKYIGIIVGVIGIILIPFLKYIIKDYTNINNLEIYYILFLINSIISYFYAHKRTLLSADQKDYVSAKYRGIFSIVKSIFQIIVLVLTKSFILFLIVQLFTTFFENYFISKKANVFYPYIKHRNSFSVSKDLKKQIIDDVKALAITKFGYVILNGSGNIIISSFIGIILVGKLSNYSLIISTMVLLLSQISNGMTASIGNYFTIETKERKIELFNNISFLYFWLYSVTTIMLISFMNPFMQLWIGKEYVLPQEIIVVIAINFFIDGILSVFWVFRTTLGLFTQWKTRPIVVAVVNISLSLILVKNFGLIGVLLATTISRTLVNVWYEPFVILKHGLKTNTFIFYRKYILRLVTSTLVAYLMYSLSVKVIYNNFLIAFLSVVVSFALVNIIYILIYRKNSEYIYLRNITIVYMKKIFMWLKITSKSKLK